MRYFDFHTHVILKQLFNAEPNNDARISRKDVAGIPRACSDLPNIIQTQIHQSQLASIAEEVIVGVALYALERNLAEQVLTLVHLLKPGSRYKISPELLTDVVNNQYTSFSGFTVSRTLNRYLSASESFNVLTSNSFNTSLPQNKVNIFFTVEGCHSLVDSHNQFSPPGQKFPPIEILNNLDRLIASVRILSVNLTHVQQSNLCNHAFGMQLTKVDPFLPTGNGLQDDGRQVIQGLFDRKICVDVKHMSYKSRRDLMEEIDAGKYQNVQPVLCTHTGFTGIPFQDWTGYIKTRLRKGNTFYLETAKTMQVRNLPQRRPAAPAFNMSTINLFDEEIVWIVRNNGMLGLSLDRRIIGYVDPHDQRPRGQDQGPLFVDKEFFSIAEWQDLSLGNKIGHYVNENDCVLGDDVEATVEKSIPTRNEYFLDHILLHLKHYLQVCRSAGIPISKAKKHITLGSDFDGLINPFLNLETVSDMADLKEYLKDNLGFYLRALNDSAVWIDELDPIDDFVEDLFYVNGYNFIKKHL